MKRLKKLSSTMTLYHGTNNTLFQQIYRSGQILSRNETGIQTNRGLQFDITMLDIQGGQSNSYEKRQINLYDANEYLATIISQETIFLEIDGENLQYSTKLRNEIKSSSDKIFNEYPKLKNIPSIRDEYGVYDVDLFDEYDLQDENDNQQFDEEYYTKKGYDEEYISELRQDHENWLNVRNTAKEGNYLDFVNELKQKTIDVVAINYSTSENESVVYLGNKETVLSDYATSRIYEGDYPTFGVLIEVQVNESSLGPDLYDTNGDFDFFSDKPPWQQTLETTGQVVYYGNININQIQSVTFVSNGINTIGKNFDYNKEEFLSWSSQFITWDQPLNIDEANNQIENLNNEWDKLSNKEVNSSKIKRLMKK